jgi:hypothetical protein
MVMSFTNCAWSQTEVAEATGVFVEIESVGRETVVLVGCAGGNVGVLNSADCVNCACTVNAAWVKMIFGSSVTGACEGRLHEERIKMSVMLKMRMNLVMMYSSFDETILLQG